MSDVFISYSRLDKDFVGKLRDALAARDEEVWIDWEDIPPSQAWWNEIQKGIARSNNIIVILSSHSMESPTCHMEIEYARKLGKRIIPIHYLEYEVEACLASLKKRLTSPAMDGVRDLWGDRYPDLLMEANDSALDQINFFFFGPDDDFPTRTDELIEIIRTDYQYKERHTTLQLRAVEWDRRARNVSFLLLDDELAEAQEWLLAAAGKSPAPTPLHEEYIRASEKRTRQLRTTRRISVIGSALAVVAVAFAIIASIIGTRATNNLRIAQDREAFAYAESTLAADARIQAEDLALTALANQATLENSAATLHAAATQIPPTLTQAAVIRLDALDEQDIAARFANALLGLADAPEEGLARLDALVADYPQRPSVLVYRGLGYDHLGQIEQAIENYSLALALDPGFALAYYNRGLAYYENGDLDLALTDFNRTVALDPGDTYAYINRGNVYFDMGELEQAISDYDLAIADDPGYALVFNNRGLAYALMADYEQALTDFNRAIELDPGYALAYLNRGNARNNLGDYDLALADFDRALERNPDLENLHFNRGLASYFLGEYEQAIVDFSAAIERDPVNANAFLGRGLAYASLQDDEAALADWSMAESLGIELPQTVQALREAIIGQATPTPGS